MQRENRRPAPQQAGQASSHFINQTAESFTMTSGILESLLSSYRYEYSAAANALFIADFASDQALPSVPSTFVVEPDGPPPSEGLPSSGVLQKQELVSSDWLC